MHLLPSCQVLKKVVEAQTWGATSGQTVALITFSRPVPKGYRNEDTHHPMHHTEWEGLSFKLIILKQLLKVACTLQ